MQSDTAPHGARIHRAFEGGYRSTERLALQAILFPSLLEPRQQRDVAQPWRSVPTFSSTTTRALARRSAKRLRISPVLERTDMSRLALAVQSRPTGHSGGFFRDAQIGARTECPYWVAPHESVRAPHTVPSGLRPGESAASR